MQIYLDYSATTPTRPEAIAIMESVLKEQWGNPSSLHQWGNRAALILETARIQVAGLINAVPESIIFTSGGTESDNLAIMGVAQYYHQPQHIIISSVEHSAISAPISMLESWGWQITRLQVDRKARVNPEDLKLAFRDNTVLVSIIYGQSEVGTVQPILDLAKITKSNNVLFHTDAVQVGGRLPLDVNSLPVDLLSLSSHKIYGPLGAGALYVRPGVQLIPLLGGGGQENNLRSGTQALPAIAGFGVAAKLAGQELEMERPRLIQLRDRLFSKLAHTPGLIPTGDMVERLPHHVSFCIDYADGERISGKTLVRQLNLAGIGISAGAACNSGKLTPSPVLVAMGYGGRLALGGIRLTIGKETTVADIDWTVVVLQQILHRLLKY
ncbi:aminotransferase class V-fold PLP-dependent enzyme [Cylindrospermopsis raciborskii CHAB3438]|jgi:cysteine desulfurase|uniref:cysteine desulfurase family protein n=1 Tax=Cylindrospermopsis TaxID=77021 RepID=UPI00070D51B9|nr:MULTISPECIES: cysteine desulfurase family protein [Cylindrospermopsis]MBU6345224.1 cysteine desulfurase [Cyanobacteria bacterium REEB494]KRH95818.1 cysteine desulfurase [Cylindrospermopsis sp. CR12]MCH4903056.1 aminotransferase class V-fold PLP-dependent enzyme [Cylindrospermopsis raciborskii CHAB3438]MEB3145765.1 cysteine desulfurase family protein [Cylindrospermopsis raciborskii]TPX29431.1 cysteine desulfurase [Cylindrospermopsis raciborskii GIHE 2018]